MKIMASVCGVLVLAAALSSQAADQDVRAAGAAKFPAETVAGMELIPAGKFEMGDHHGFVDPKHGGDETPIHTVRVDAFYMAVNDVTTRQYCEFLNSSLAQKQIAVKQGGVYLTDGNDLLCETRTMSQYSRIGWDGTAFSVLDKKENHPIVCIRWAGAAVYCNWLSVQKKLPPCYNTATWDCDFNKSGFRLPTEAEWEYAARGGQQKPYWNFPWANEADPAKANWPQSKNPYRTGPQPWTTPVGFYDGKLHRKADFGWPGDEETFQAANGVNGFGLYDMAGNVWQFINDWYVRDYYAFSPSENPPGPERGNIMPDGKPYRGMRGGNWYNGEDGHSRVSNRNPSYWRGPLDPNHPYYHVSFRVVLPVDAESRPAVKLTPVLKVDRIGPSEGGARPPRDNNRPPRDPNRPSRDGNRPPQDSTPSQHPDTQQQKPAGSFVLRSSEIKSDGILPADYTADGNSATLPLEWSGAPAATKSYAVIMHHMDPKGVAKWYWTLYNIPATVQSLPRNVKDVGTLGTNSVNDRTEYAPPKSKGPGPKVYVYTVYALSAAPQITVSPDKVNREALLAAMKNSILASAELSVTYTRPDNAVDKTDDRRPNPNPGK